MSRDGVHVHLHLNAGLLVDLPHLDQAGGEGIGLFRTELQFMVQATMPRLSVQTDLYQKVLEAAGDRPVLFRTLDLGGDKVLPYIAQEREENPAIGWRAIRIGLDRPALLRYQIRALLAAAKERKLSLMFPMITEVAEFDRAHALVDREIVRRERMGQPMPSEVRIGVMLEVPALAMQLDALCARADFVSVGSNDLMQFLFAADRGNSRLAGRYDTLSPAFLRFLHLVATACDAKGIPVSVCGEMAGRPLEAMALLAIGFRSISMPPAGVGPVKVMIRSLHIERLRELVLPLIDSPRHSLRPDLQAFAERENVAI